MKKLLVSLLFLLPIMLLAQDSTSVGTIEVSPNAWVGSLLIGVGLYFFMEFKSRAINTFSLGYWFKDNWINLGILVLANLAYINLIGTPTKEIAFVMGLLPNLAVDWVQDLIGKYKTKTT